MSFMNINTKVKDYFTDNPNPSLLMKSRFRIELMRELLRENYHDYTSPCKLTRLISEEIREVEKFKITVPRQKRPRPKASDLPTTVRSVQVLNRKSNPVYAYRVELWGKPGIFYALNLKDIQRNTLTPSSYIRR